jgi:hypothetical protein
VGKSGDEAATATGHAVTSTSLRPLALSW